MTVNGCQTWPGESLYWEECCQSSNRSVDWTNWIKAIRSYGHLTWPFCFGGGGWNWWIDLRYWINSSNLVGTLGGGFFYPIFDLYFTWFDGSKFKTSRPVAKLRRWRHLQLHPRKSISMKPSSFKVKGWCFFVSSCFLWVTFLGFWYIPQVILEENQLQICLEKAMLWRSPMQCGTMAVILEPTWAQRMSIGELFRLEQHLWIRVACPMILINFSCAKSLEW